MWVPCEMCVCTGLWSHTEAVAYIIIAMIRSTVSIENWIR